MSSPERWKPISERALFARVQRHLAKQQISLHRCRRDSRWRDSLAPYYSSDSERNNLCDPCFRDEDEMEQYARDEGLMQECEFLKLG